MFFFHDSLVDLKKKKTGAGGYAQISDRYVVYISSFFQLFQKVQVSG